jgi:hypothetical protein
MRSVKEIRAAEHECREFVFYDHAMGRLHRIEHHGEPMPDEDRFDAMMERVKELEAEYGDAIVPENDFEAGENHGRLEALRYVLGSDWGDTGCEEDEA